MLEQIYTIPVNEVFDASAADASCGCPFCRLEERLYNDEYEIILGASMMEPDIRIKTNEMGFCQKCYAEMFTRKNRLGMGLMLESHLDEVISKISPGGLGEMLSGKGKKACEELEKLERSCYVCSRVRSSMSHMLSNAALLWETEKEFVQKLKKQPYFCLGHYRRFINAGREHISKKKFADFYSQISELEVSALKELREDVSWFCKKFDYRYDAEPWKNSKDAVERAIKYLK